MAGYGEDIGDVAADRMGLENDGPRPRLYRNMEGDGFEDVTREVGTVACASCDGREFRGPR